MRKRVIAAVVFAAALIIALVTGLVVYFVRRGNSISSAVNVDTNLIIIVGAGIAGASAALELSRAGRPFLILEAQDVVGGRIVQGKLGSLSVELGANWIHDYGEGHEVESIASQLNLGGTPTNFEDRAYYSDGIKVSSAMPWSSLQTVWRKAITTAATGDDITILDALSTYSSWEPQTAIDCAMLQYVVDYSLGLPSSKASAYQVDAGNVDPGTPASERFIKDNRGYLEIVQDLLRKAGVNDTKTSGTNLKLGAPVRTIEYGDNGAKVYLRNGDVHEAAAVISTVSLGVLKDNKINFKPELSAAKKTAMSKMAMGSYTKIFVQLSEQIFTASDPMLLIPTNCDRAVNVHNLNKPQFFPGSNAVLVTAMGGYSGDEKDIVVAALQAVTKRKIEKSLISQLAVLNFDSAKYVRGAYSNRLVGFTDADLNALRTPQGALYLAGEMLGQENYGNVKTALTSGKETAKRVVKEK